MDRYSCDGTSVRLPCAVEYTDFGNFLRVKRGFFEMGKLFTCFLADKPCCSFLQKTIQIPITRQKSRINVAVSSYTVNALFRLGNWTCNLLNGNISVFARLQSRLWSLLSVLMHTAWNCAQTSLFVYAVCKFPFRFNRTVCVSFVRCACGRIDDYVPCLTCSLILLESFLARWSCDRLTSRRLTSYLSRLIWPRYADRFLRRIEHLIGDILRHVFTDWFPSVVLMQCIHKENFIEGDWKFKLIRRQFPTNAQCFCQYTSEIQQMWNEWTTRRVGLLV